MKLASYPSTFTPSLPPKDGNAYRIVWRRSNALAFTLSSLRYSLAGWAIRDAEGRWAGFAHLGAVVAHNPQALELEVPHANV